MILENLPMKYKNRLPVCTSKVNDQTDMLLYIPPAYHVYFNSLNDSGSVTNGHTTEVIQREHTANCCKRKTFQLYEQQYSKAQKSADFHIHYKIFLRLLTQSYNERRSET